MLSYSFQQPELSGEELKFLFGYLAENPEFKCTCAYEIIESYRTGHLDTGKEFNLEYFQKAFTKNSKLVDLKGYSKVKSGDEPVYSDSDETILDMQSSSRDNYEELIDLMSSSDNIAWLHTNAIEIAAVYNVDIFKLIDNALCNDVAASTLARICSLDTRIADGVKDVLERRLVL